MSGPVMGRHEPLMVGVAGLGAAAVVVTFGHTPPVGFEAFTASVMTAVVAVGWIYLLAGVVVRRRRLLVGTLLLIAGVLWFLQYLVLAPVGWLFVVGVALGERHLVPVAHLMLALPDGRLTTAARRLIWTVYVTAIALSMSTPFVLDRACPPLPCPTPRPTSSAPSWFQDLVLTVDQFGTAVLAVLVGGVLALRLLRSDGAARRQIAPVLLAGTLLVPVYASSQLGVLPAPAGIWLYLAVNAAVPFAVLSGLAWARIQRGAVADLVVALDHDVTGEHLHEALARCLGDPFLRVLFPREGAEDVWLDGHGRPVAGTSGPRRVSKSVIEDGRVIAVLDHDRALLDEPELLEAAVTASRLALRNARLTAQVRAQLDELQGAQTRLVRAVDQERRRLERDLHDGVQQQLLAVALELGRTRRQATGLGDQQLARSLDRTRLDLEQAIDELRRFARGIHPQVLTDRGVPEALEALSQRAPLPVEVDASLGRLPAEVESTLYLVATEAVTNAVRHGSATQLTIHAHCHDGQVVLEIADDGRGGAQPSDGGGLQGIGDRVTALGGRLNVDSPPGHGTRLHVDLPLSSS